jgi:hypothetical protein
MNNWIQHFFVKWYVLLLVVNHFELIFREYKYVTSKDEDKKEGKDILQHQSVAFYKLVSRLWYKGSFKLSTLYNNIIFTQS